MHLKNIKITLTLSLAILTGSVVEAQKVVRTQPIWWFGQSAAANFNFYNGTTQTLNETTYAPTAFHDGKGVKPYFSLLTEYRPNRVWGGTLNLAFDNRGGKFDGVMAPCNCPATLSTSLSYLAIEPSLRLAPFKSAFYLFAGPTVGINLSKEFEYTQEKQPDVKGDFSDIRKVKFGAQAGLGLDIPVSNPQSSTQMAISPFASFQTDMMQNPREMESWSLYTVRAGIALKFGTGKGTKPTVATPDAPRTLEKDVAFSVRAPLVVPASRQVKETFPLRNSVFFNLGSTEIPSRYVQLNNASAASFRESQLQEAQPDNLNRGRSARQMAVYYNILNIVGDRLRSNPSSTIALTGAADKNAAEGKLLAENVKQYLVNVFGINGNRISTEGRDKPLIPSEQSGSTKDLDLLREGDRRVDIVSTSPELLLQVGGVNSSFLKPVQITAVQANPMDSHVIFNVAGATEVLKSWNIEVTDAAGRVQNYGPYSKDQASIPGTSILGNATEGNYKVAMLGTTKTGMSVRKESSVSLQKVAGSSQEGLRYSILFDFDRSKSIATYEKFLSEVVAPLVSDNSTVIIHGYTDIIGEEGYNHTLSHERAKGAEAILKRALSAAGKKNVKFETFGVGEDTDMSPFDNNFPEERFYNRTVIIDVVANK